MARSLPELAEEFLLSPTDPDRCSFGQTFERLVGIMGRLRGEAGCPWDRAQSLESLKPFLLEETYEVLDAIDQGDPEAHKEELGDLLLQVVFQAEIRRQEGRFDAADVAQAISDKLVRRHPHVFAGDHTDRAEATELESGWKRWEAIKASEKGPRSTLAGVPRALPALLRAQRVQEKASRVGFDWPEVSGPLDKLTEELGELREAMAQGDREAISHELGDLLFSLVNLARFLDLVAEEALRSTVDRFTRRFEYVEAQARTTQRPIEDHTPEALDALWEEAKRNVP